MSKTKKMVIATVIAAVLSCPGAASAHDKQGAPRVSDSSTGREGVRTDERKTITKAASSFDQTKASCLEAVGRRQAKLDRLSAKVAATADPHDAALVALITTAQSGLIAAQAAIEGIASDSTALKDACRGVVTDLRIYALRVPQINLVMTIDKVAAAMVKFDALHGQLVDAVAASAAAGDPDAAKAQEQLGKLEAKLASAGAKIDAIDVSALLAITPSAYNADKKVLRPFLQDVRAVRADVKKAAQLARHIARLLEPGDGDDDEA